MIDQHAADERGLNLILNGVWWRTAGSPGDREGRLVGGLVVSLEAAEEGVPAADPLNGWLFAELLPDSEASGAETRDAGNQEG